MTRNTDNLLVTNMYGGPCDGALWCWSVEPPRGYVHPMNLPGSRVVHHYEWTGELWSWSHAELIETKCKGK